jgi:hypothetical protein
MKLKFLGQTVTFTKTEWHSIRYIGLITPLIAGGGGRLFELLVMKQSDVTGWYVVTNVTKAYTGSIFKV